MELLYILIGLAIFYLVVMILATIFVVVVFIYGLIKKIAGKE